MDKYCRICWNTKNWRSPSGDARHIEMGGSYVSQYGFGHEEWLFNFNWLLRGYQQDSATAYHYGFLQPIGKFRKYQGKTFSVLLYTVSPERQVLIVARIDQLYVPDDEELAWAQQSISTNGWLAAMRQELEDLGIDSQPLNASWVVNVRFRPQDVHFYDPRPVVTGGHKIRTAFRYHPFDWDDGFPPVETMLPVLLNPDTSNRDDDPVRSEAQRTRSAIEGTSYDPRHTQLQNRLYRFLCARYGRRSVAYENNFVDLSLHIDGKTIFIEIKMDLTAKRCIRLALGQLLEYSHYPNQAKASRLLVVGDALPKSEDIMYLNHVRGLYKFPLYYARWDWDKEELEAEI